MNAGFVCIKVDREERPDIDAVYMNATVALTGQGGWPMTCFLTPDGRPFFCGTYYPKAGFLQLLSAVSETWRNRRGEVEQASDHIAGELRKMAAGTARRRPARGAGAVRPRGGSGAARRGRRARRVRRRTEVPAVGAAGGAAAHLRAHRIDRRRWTRWSAPAPRWPAAASTTSWPAASPATASTTLGWYRISRRCCTTTRCCCARTRTGRGAPEIRWRAGSRGRPPTSCCDDLADGDCSPRRWTPTPTGARARPTCGRRRSCARCSATTTDVGPQAFSRSPRRDVRTRRVGAAAAGRPRRCRTAGPGPGRAAGRPAAPAPSRPATTRSSPPGTGWRSPRWPRPVVALDGPNCSTPQRVARRHCWTSHLVDGRLRRASLGGVVGDSAAILEDYAALATGLLTLYQLTGERALADGGRRADRHRAGAFRRPRSARPMVRHRRRRRGTDAAPRRPVDGATPSGASTITEALLTAAHLVDADRAERYFAAGGATRCGAHSPLLARAAAFGRALAGRRRGGGSWTASDRGGLRCRRLAAAGRRRAGWRPAARSSSAAQLDSSELLAGPRPDDGADAAYVCRGRVCDLPVTQRGGPRGRAGRTAV